MTRFLPPNGKEKRHGGNERARNGEIVWKKGMFSNDEICMCVTKVSIMAVTTFLPVATTTTTKNTIRTHKMTTHRKSLFDTCVLLSQNSPQNVACERIGP